MSKYKLKISVLLLVSVLLAVSVLAFLPASVSPPHSVLNAYGGVKDSVELTGTNFVPSPDYAYLATGTDNVTVINATTNTIVGNITTVQSTSAVYVTPNGTYLLAVSVSGKGISVIDLSTLKTVAVMPTTGIPAYLSIAPNGKYAYLTVLGSDYIFAYSLTNFPTSVSGAVQIQVGFTPGRITFSMNGTLGFVTSMIASNGGVSHNMTVFSAVTNTVIKNIDSSALSDPMMAAPSLNGSDLLVGNSVSSQITEFSLSNYTVVDEITAGSGIQWLSFDPLNGFLYYLFNSNSNPSGTANIGAFLDGLNSASLVTSVSTSGSVYNASFADGGNYLYVPDKNPNELVQFQTSSLSDTLPTLPLGFTPGGIAVPSTEYVGNVIINEKGVPNNSSWSVIVGTLTFSTVNASMVVYQFYGNYSLNLPYVNFSRWVNPPQSVNIGFDSPTISLDSTSVVQQGQYRNDIYAVNYKQISIYAPGNGSLVGNLNFNNPLESEVVSPSGNFLYSANISRAEQITTITKINLETFKTVGTLYIPNTPNYSYLSMNPDGKFIYVSTDSYNLTVVSLSSFSIAKVMNVTFNSGSVAFTPNGSLGFSFSVNPQNSAEVSDNMTVFNAYNNTVIANVSSPLLQDPFEGAVSPNGSLLLIGNYNDENVTAFNIKSMTFEDNVFMAGYPDYVVFNRNGSLAYVTSSTAGSNFTILNAGSLQYVANINTSIVGLTYISLSENGTYAYVNGFSNGVYGINLTTHKVTKLLPSLSGSEEILIPATAYVSSVTVKETGLAPSSNWSFTVENETFHSSGNQLTAYAFFGNVSYSAVGSSGFFATDNGTGTMSVNADTGTILLHFVTDVSVNVSGLSTNAQWYLNVTGYESFGPFTSNTSVIRLPYGNYTATVSSTGYNSTTLNLSISSSGEHYQTTLNQIPVKKPPSSPGLNRNDLLIAAGVAGIAIVSALVYLSFRKRR